MLIVLHEFIMNFVIKSFAHELWVELRMWKHNIYNSQHIKYMMQDLQMQA